MLIIDVIRGRLISIIKIPTPENFIFIYWIKAQINLKW